jgi:hypothetical protein
MGWIKYSSNSEVSASRFFSECVALLLFQWSGFETTVISRSFSFCVYRLRSEKRVQRTGVNTPYDETGPNSLHRLDGINSASDLGKWVHRRSFIGWFF